MKKLKIDPEFKSLIPPLSPDEYKQLENNLKDDGCRDALIVWDDTIIDGHNRYEICTQNKIPYATREMDFEDRQEAITWIIKNQFGRRNLPSVDRVRLALKLKDVIAEKAKKHQEGGQGGKLLFQEVGKAKVEPIHTDKELGKIAGVSHETIRRYELIQKEGTDEVKKGVDSGEMSISKGFDTLRKSRYTEVTYPAKVAVEVELRYCKICKTEKPVTEFYGRDSECKSCRKSRMEGNLSAGEARRLAEKYPDELMNKILDGMKNPPTKQVVRGNNRNPIIAELEEVLNQINIDINKFTFMGPQNPDHEATKMLDTVIFNLTKIKSYVKER